MPPLGSDLLEVELSLKVSNQESSQTRLLTGVAKCFLFWNRNKLAGSSIRFVVVSARGDLPICRHSRRNVGDGSCSI